MPRGLFPQSLTVLFDEAPSLDQVAEALAGREVLGREAGSAEAGWIGGFPELRIAYRPELNGVVTVEVVPRRWPDAMGDPRGDEADQELFGAFGLGAFGPGAFPGNLARAVTQAVSFKDRAAQVAEQHGAFLRLRLSYALGAGPDAPMSPERADATDEVLFLLELARPLLELPGALALFNPNAELLLPRDQLESRLEVARREYQAPVDAFAHVRLFDPQETPGWILMDTVGLAQLGLPDQEVCVPDGFSPNEVAGFLYSLALYLVQSGPVIEPTHTVEGPGGVWRCLVASDDGLVPAPRATLRWAPDGVDVPAALAQA